ncbi:MAG: hypothetical protein AAF542_24160 [Pseudomonadota bacterium]
MRLPRIIFVLGLLIAFAALVLLLADQEHNTPRSIQPAITAQKQEKMVVSTKQGSVGPSESSTIDGDADAQISREHCNPDKVFQEHANSTDIENEDDYPDTQELAGTLSVSDNLDDLALSSMMRDGEPENRIKTALRVLETNSSHPLALVSLLRGCSANPDVSECGAQLHELVRDGDKQNGVYWFLLANWQLAQGKEEHVEDLLGQAASSPVYNSYWATTVSAFDKALERHFKLAEHWRALTASGFAGAVALDDYQPLFEFCKREGVAFTHRRSECARFAEQLENNGMTVFDLTIGLVLQFRMAQLEGNQELVKSIETRRAANRHKRQRDREASAALLLKGMEVDSDPVLLIEYMQGLSVYGEIRMLDFSERVYERKFGPLPECG